MKELNSFFFAFQISSHVVFEVRYYRCGGNKNKHFSTSAAHFTPRKNDFDHCGQAQDDLLTGAAMKFYKKWDHLHTTDLTATQHAEIINDIEELKQKYNFIFQTQNDFSFNDLRELSKFQMAKKTRS